MLAGPLRLSLYLLLVCISTADNLKKNITIGYLPAIKGEMRDRQGRIASGAIQMAVDKVTVVLLNLNYFLYIFNYIISKTTFLDIKPIK